MHLSDRLKSADRARRKAVNKMLASGLHVYYYRGGGLWASGPPGEQHHVMAKKTRAAFLDLA
jgi:hypothetical protein